MDCIIIISTLELSSDLSEAQGFKIKGDKLKT